MVSAPRLHESWLRQREVYVYFGWGVGVGETHTDSLNVLKDWKSPQKPACVLRCPAWVHIASVFSPHQPPVSITSIKCEEKGREPIHPEFSATLLSPLFPGCWNTRDIGVDSLHLCAGHVWEHLWNFKYWKLCPIWTCAIPAYLSSIKCSLLGSARPSWGCERFWQTSHEFWP